MDLLPLRQFGRGRPFSGADAARPIPRSARVLSQARPEAATTAHRELWRHFAASREPSRPRAAWDHALRRVSLARNGANGRAEACAGLEIAGGVFQGRAAGQRGELRRHLGQ